MANERIDLREAAKIGHAMFVSAVVGSAVVALGVRNAVTAAIEYKLKLKLKSKVKFILYLSTNYPKQNYNRVCKKMEGKSVKEWEILLDSYKKKYKVQV